MANNTTINDDQAVSEKLKSLELTNRPEQSLAGRAIYWLGVAFALLHVYFNTLGTWSELYVSAIHFGGFAFICALMVPMFKTGGEGRQRLALVLDVLLGVAAILCTLYLIGFEDALYERGGEVCSVGLGLFDQCDFYSARDGTSYHRMVYSLPDSGGPNLCVLVG